MTMPPPGQWPPPPQGPPQGPPQWNPQQGPPPKGGNKAKWILGGLALLVVVVVSMVATLLVTRSSSGSTTPTASGPPSTSVDASNIASADDREPAGIITDDPTCSAWGPTNAAFVHASDGGWGQRDPTIPADRWTPDQRSQYEAVGAALNAVADRSVQLARQTPHRPMRELYEQFAAYGRAYAERIQNYTAEADQLARVAVSTSSAVTAICDAITYGSAGARMPLVARAAPPTVVANVDDSTRPQRFLTTAGPVCADWLSAVDRFSTDTEAWRTIDPNIPSAQLDERQRDINAAVMPIMQSFATNTQILGRKSKNPVLEDFATLSAQYRRAYVSALPTYTPADNYLQMAAGSAAGAVSGACRAAGT
ncbi:hypothetical protein EV589_0222 [Mycobacterium sp. BK558]|nr:hypothetical protein EV589_0222 [Mycobacterium sp. BK558]